MVPTYVAVVPETAEEKRMKLRYAGTCRLCGIDLPARVEAVYERTTKTVRCLACSPAFGSPAAIDIGTPGGSARREYERRHDKREQRIRTKHPKIGGLILGLSDDPQSTTAWQTGALGEERLGQRLNALASDSVRVLHDRRIPGSRANIDHVAVTASGIYVIDAKKYAGRPSLRVEGGIIRQRTERLMVGSRDCTKLVDGVLKQTAVVRDQVPAGVPVIGVLSFIEADWPLIGGAFTTRGTHVMWPKKLYPRLSAPGPLPPSTVADPPPSPRPRAAPGLTATTRTRAERSTSMAAEWRT